MTRLPGSESVQFTHEHDDAPTDAGMARGGSVHRSPSVALLVQGGVARKARGYRLSDGTEEERSRQSEVAVLSLNHRLSRGSGAARWHSTIRTRRNATRRESDDASGLPSVRLRRHHPSAYPATASPSSPQGNGERGKADGGHRTNVCFQRTFSNRVDASRGGQGGIVWRDRRTNRRRGGACPPTGPATKVNAAMRRAVWAARPFRDDAPRRACSQRASSNRRVPNPSPPTAHVIVCTESGGMGSRGPNATMPPGVVGGIVTACIRLQDTSVCPSCQCHHRSDGTGAVPDRDDASPTLRGGIDSCDKPGCKDGKRFGLPNL